MLRIVYFSLAFVMCLSIMLLGLWPWAIKPQLNAFVSQRIHELGAAHGVLIRTGEISLLSYNTFELDSAKVEDAAKAWSVQLPKAKVTLSALALIFGKQPIRAIQLKEPQVLLSFEKSMGESQDSFVAPQTLQEIVIDNGTIQIEDLAHHSAARIFHLDVNVHKEKSVFVVSLNTPQLWIQTKDLSLDQGSIRLFGALGPLSFDLSHFEFESPLGLLSATGSFSFDQGKKELVADGTFSLREIEFEDINIDHVNGLFNFDQGILSLANIQARFGNALVMADASVNMHNGHATIAAGTHGMSLYHLLLDLGIKPSWVDMGIDARLSAQGTLWPDFSLKGRVAGQASNLIVANRSARNLQSRDIIIHAPGPIDVESAIAIDLNSFRFYDARINDKRTFGTAECTLYFDMQQGLVIEAISNHIDFASIGQQIADQHYSGIGKLKAKINGPYKDLRVDVDAKVDDFFFEGIAFGNLGGGIVYHRDNLSFTDVAGATRFGQYRGDLVFHFLEDISMDLKVHEVEASLPFALESFTKLFGNLEGTLIGDVHIFGPIEDGQRHKLQGTANFHFANGLKIGPLQAQTFDFASHMTTKEWVIDSAQANLGEGLASLKGSVAKETLASNLVLDITKLPLSTFKSDRFLSALTGQLDAHVEISKNLDRPSLSGEIELSKVETPHFQLRNQVFKLSSDDDFVRVSGTLLSGLAQLEGQISRGHDFAYSTKISWPYTALNRYMSEGSLLESTVVEFAGALNFAGSKDRLVSDGQLTIRDGYFSSQNMLTPLVGLSADLSFNDHEILLSELSGHSDRGAIDANGRATLENLELREVVAHVNVKDFAFQFANLLSGVTSGFLDYRKSGKELSLSGDLNLREGYIAGKLDKGALKLARPGSTFVSPIRLDLRITSDDPIKVDTDIISGNLEGQLRVVGTQLSPGLQGAVELKLGKAFFRNQNYQLRKARIDFDDAYHIVPRLDVLAQSDIENYQVQVHLQGTPERPLFRLTSEPFLPEPQLLMLLSLGYVADSKSFASTAQMAGLEALSLYSGVGQNVARFLNSHGKTKFFQIDELNLSSLFSKTDGVSLPALRLGMNVWSGLRLRLHSAIVENEKGKREQRVELEQNLGPQTKWRVAWDSEGQSNYGDAGADLWYRWEWR